MAEEQQAMQAKLLEQQQRQAEEVERARAEQRSLREAAERQQAELARQAQSHASQMQEAMEARQRDTTVLMSEWEHQLRRYTDDTFRRCTLKQEAVGTRIARLESLVHDIKSVSLPELEQSVHRQMAASVESAEARMGALQIAVQDAISSKVVPLEQRLRSQLDALSRQCSSGIAVASAAQSHSMQSVEARLGELQAAAREMASRISIEGVATQQLNSVCEQLSGRVESLAHAQQTQLRSKEAHSQVATEVAMEAVAFSAVVASGTAQYESEVVAMRREIVEQQQRQMERAHSAQQKLWQAAEQRHAALAQDAQLHRAQTEKAMEAMEVKQRELDEQHAQIQVDMRCHADDIDSRMSQVIDRMEEAAAQNWAVDSQLAAVNSQLETWATQAERGDQVIAQRADHLDARLDRLAATVETEAEHREHMKVWHAETDARMEALLSEQQLKLQPDAVGKDTAWVSYLDSWTNEIMREVDALKQCETDLRAELGRTIDTTGTLRNELDFIHEKLEREFEHVEDRMDHRMLLPSDFVRAAHEEMQTLANDRLQQELAKDGDAPGGDPTVAQQMEPSSSAHLLLAAQAADSAGSRQSSVQQRAMKEDVRLALNRQKRPAQPTKTSRSTDKSAPEPEPDTRSESGAPQTVATNLAEVAASAANELLIELVEPSATPVRLNPDVTPIPEASPSLLPAAASQHQPAEGLGASGVDASGADDEFWN
jgi:hypothetical protein